MAYFMTTPLGRSVRRSDWDAFHQDTILKLLYDLDEQRRVEVIADDESAGGARGLPRANEAHAAIALQALEIATGQRPGKLRELCDALVQQRLIELRPGDGGRIARLTSLGRAEVGQRLAFVRLLARLSEL
jgi:hypothetical protein